MNLSYRNKIYKNLMENKVNKQILIACLCKIQKQLKPLLNSINKYTNSDIDTDDKKEQAKFYLDEAKPFKWSLYNDYGLCTEEIAALINDTISNPKLSKNIPSFEMVDDVKKCLNTGKYILADK